MAALYLTVGMFLGAFAGVVIMAMFVIAKRADDNAIEITSKLTPIITQQETTT
jgi:hypothetical protein